MHKLSAAIVLMALIIAGCGSPQGDKAAKDPAAGPRDAAKKGVEFLVKNQNADGSFGGEKYASVGITSLAGIAIKSSPRRLSPEQKKALAKAVVYIKKHVQTDGSIHNKLQGYEHYHTSLATMALLRIDPDQYRDLIGGARSYMINSQHYEKSGFKPEDSEYGGWRYGKPTDTAKAKPDLSNTQFVLSALKESGLPGDSETYKRTVQFLQRCQHRTETNDMKEGFADDGSAVYSPVATKAETVTLPNGKKIYKGYGSMTYALLKSYIFCSIDKKDPRVQAAYKWLRENYTVAENTNMGQQGLYYYYFTMARALQAYGEPIIETPDGVKHKWAEELSARIVSLQAEDGSWSNPQDRWYEGDKALVTSYAVWTLNICDQVMKKK